MGHPETQGAGEDDKGASGLLRSSRAPTATLGPLPRVPPSHQLNPIMHVYIMATYNSAIYIQLQASLCAHKILTLEGRLLQKCL